MGPLNLLILCLAFVCSSSAILSDLSIEGRQSAAALPACATKCLVTLLPSSKCAASNTTCLCADTEFLTASSLCVQSNCTVKETLTTAKIQATALCPTPIRDDSGETKVIVAVIYSFAIIAVTARTISRLPATGGSGFGWDDWTILISLALLTPLNILCWMMANHGLGRDIWMLEFWEITRILYFFWIDEYLYTFVIDMTKISILLVYLRMFADADSDRFRRACYILIGILALHATVMNTVLAVGCHPTDYAWNQWDGEHEGRCISYTGQIYSTAALNIVFDLLVFFFPIPKLIRLSFSSQRKKIALCATFLVGLFITIVSIIRLQYLAVWGTSTNLSWGYNPIAIWSNIECNGSVICACMPSLAGLVQRLWARLAGKTLSSYGRGSVATATASCNDDPPSNYELRLRSSSLRRPEPECKCKEKQMMYANGLELNPVDSRNAPHHVAPGFNFESEESLDTSPSARAHGEGRRDMKGWYATKPLPHVSDSV